MASTPRRVGHVGLYGDVDLNIIDGSAIWLASVAEMLTRRDDLGVTLLLKAPLKRHVVTAAIERLPAVKILPPEKQGGARLTPEAAVRQLEQIDRTQRFDLLVLRGFELCTRAAESRQLRGRLWCYLTDVPQRIDDLDDSVLLALRSISDGSAALLCQTEELRGFLGAALPDAADRMILLPPMVPAIADIDEPTAQPRRLVYAGKFAPMWGIIEMIRAFETIRSRHTDVEFHVIGDKIHNPPELPDYRPTIEALLSSTPGLVWHGGVAREEVARLVSGATLALSARAAGLDDSLELSTKLLEYGQAGVPVVINRTPMHERLMGESYPFLIDDIDTDLTGVIELALTHPDEWERARSKLRAASDDFTLDAVHRRLRSDLDFAVPPEHCRGSRRVLVAGHDLKFFRAIGDYLERCGHEVRYDQWAGNDRHDVQQSTDLLKWADVVVAEWCLGNAVWYSHHKRRGQRLIVRLHRVEAETDFPSRVDIDAVDAVIVVGDHYRRIVVEDLGWPPDKVHLIANDIDITSMDRYKLPDSIHNLAMIGYLPSRKRLDRALDLLEALRTVEPQFRLILKGKLPWELEWAWRVDFERDYMSAQLERIRTEPMLRDAVSFETFGPDIGSLFQKIGFVLSPSDDESFHVGLAEGMASRSVPVIWEWAHGAGLYPDDWIYDSTVDAAESMLTTVRSGSWASEGGRARQHVAGRFNRADVCAEWAKLVASTAE